MNKELTMNDPTKVSDLFYEKMSSLDHEEAWCIFLTTALYVIKIEMLTMGTLSETALDARTVIRHALLNNAASIILVHNHPGGNAEPSKSDIRLTEQIHMACKIFDISLIDHIIIAEGEYFSFSEEALRDSKTHAFLKIGKGH